MENEEMTNDAAVAWVVVVDGVADYANVHKLACDSEASVYGSGPKVEVEPLYSATTVAELRAEVERLTEQLRYVADACEHETARANAAERRVADLWDVVAAYKAAHEAVQNNPAMLLSDPTAGLKCAETTCSRLESAWLPILEAALSSHRQAGDVLARGWFHALPDDDDYEFHDDASGAGKNCPGCIRAMIVTEGSAAGPDLSKFRELAERWHSDKSDDAHSTSLWDQGFAHGRNECADDLIALVEKGAGNGQ